MGFFYRGKLGLWLPQLLGSFWGVLQVAGQLNDHPPTAQSKAQPKLCLLQQPSLKQILPGMLSGLQAGRKCLWQPWKLQPAGCTTVALNLLSPLSNHLGQARESGLLKHSWEPSGTPCSEEGNLEPQGHQLQHRLLSARLTQAAEFRAQMSLQTHLTGANRALSKGRNMSNSFPDFFWENSHLHQKRKCLQRHYFFLHYQCLKRNTGFASLHCECICTETNIWTALMLYAEATRFLPWVCLRKCYSHISCKEVPTYSDHKDPVFHKMESKAKDSSCLGDIWHLLHMLEQALLMQFAIDPLTIYFKFVSGA